jgi:serine/threonine protein kinase
VDGVAEQERVQDRRPGRVIGGRLRLDERLGEGAIGDVWRATHLESDSPVAVKLLSSRLQQSRIERHVARFLGEATLTGHVDCPHVVKVIECGLCIEAGPYIVMELVEGADLFAHLDRFGQMPVHEMATVVAHVCVALEALHDSHVFHRDVKPENIVLATRQDVPCAVLVDFGIALDGRAAAVELEAGLVGTPAYMSPERLGGAPLSHAQADLWSLAVVAYQCLVGRLPFDDTTLGTLSVSLTKGEFLRPASVRADVPEGLDGWFARALAYDPSSRFTGARDMRESLIDACAPFDLEPATGRVSETRSAFRAATATHPRLLRGSDGTALLSEQEAHGRGRWQRGGLSPFDGAT